MPKPQPKSRVPLIGASNELRDYITPERALRLEARGVAWLVRRRRDSQVMRCIQFPRPDDLKPLELQQYTGTRYHTRERLKSGHRPWKLKKLGKGDELRPVFLRVVTDCLAAKPA